MKIFLNWITALKLRQNLNLNRYVIVTGNYKALVLKIPLMDIIEYICLNKYYIKQK